MIHYLDNSATTRISREALETYVSVSENFFGNPSSLHALGNDAAHIMDEARRHAMTAIGARDGNMIFTGSGSEANNLAIFGHARAKSRYGGGKIIVSAGEHASVRAPVARLAEEGYKVCEIPTRGGSLDLDALGRELDGNTVLVSVMLVNNETGAIYDVAAAASLTHARSSAAFHCDATQALFKVPLDVRRLGVDMLSFSSHKVEGPKGVGALWVSKNTVTKRDIIPVIYGGGQESGFRSGTENVPAIAAFGEALRIGHARRNEDIAKMSALRARLLSSLASCELSAIRPNIPTLPSPHIINLTLPGIKSEVMLHFLSSRGICVSSGSACSSHSKHVSSALTAFGISEREADCSIRVSLSHNNTEDDIDALTSALADGLRDLARIQ